MRFLIVFGIKRPLFWVGFFLFQIILTLSFCLPRKICWMKNLFDGLPLRVYCHLFYCNRGFNVVNKCSYSIRFYVPKSCTSNYLENKFTFRGSFLRLIVRTFILKESPCLFTTMAFSYLIKIAIYKVIMKMLTGCFYCISFIWRFFRLFFLTN